MPLVSDYSEDEDQKATEAGHGVSGGGGGGGAVQAAPSKQQESAFVPWSRFVSANEDVSKREAGNLNQRVTGDINRVKSDTAAARTGFEDALESNYEHGQKGRAGSMISNTSAFGGQSRAAGNVSAFGPQKPGLPAGQTRADAIKGGGTVADGPRESQMTLAPYETRSGLTAAAMNGPAGSKDLESQLGPEGWSKLLGGATRAEDEAKALGSETGVQGLIQKNAAGPLAQNGRFDAALVSGQGGQQFKDTSKMGQGLLKGIGEANQGAQNAWHTLMGDIDEANRQKTATEEADRFNATLKPYDTAGPTQTKPTGSGFTPPGYNSYEDFIKQVGAGAGVHAMGMGGSPVDSALNELGKSGIYQGQTVGGYFRDKFVGGAGDQVAGSLDDQNRANAFKDLEKEYGTDAVKYLWQWMTKEMWEAMGGQNSGAIYHTLKDAIEAAIQQGNLKRQTVGAAGKKSEIQQFGGATSQDDPDAIRNGLAKGIPYTDADGKTWKSLTEWDEAHKETA